MGNWQLAATPSTLKAREETSPLLLPSGFSCLRRWRRERRQTDFLISGMYIATAAKNFFSREHISLYLSLPFLILNFPFAVCTVGAADDYHLAACWARAPSAFSSSYGSAKCWWYVTKAEITRPAVSFRGFFPPPPAHPKKFSAIWHWNPVNFVLIDPLVCSGYPGKRSSWILSL